MFGLFKSIFSQKDQAASEVYYVYKSKIEKYRQLANELQNLLAEDRKVVLLYFDLDTKEELVKILNALQIGFAENQNHFIQSKVLLNNVEFTIKNSLNENIVPILAEMNSYRSKNVELVRSLKSHSLLYIYTSLDHPVMKMFGSERMLMIMEKMGMQDNERIEHKLVTKSIINAQKKFEERN